MEILFNAALIIIPPGDTVNNRTPPFEIEKEAVILCLPSKINVLPPPFDTIDKPELGALLIFELYFFHTFLKQVQHEVLFLLNEYFIRNSSKKSS